jgi:hypothetical protein
MYGLSQADLRGSLRTGLLQERPATRERWSGGTGWKSIFKLLPNIKVLFEAAPSKLIRYGELEKRRPSTTPIVDGLGGPKPALL